MKRFIAVLLVLLSVVFAAHGANATLVDNGDGTVTDPESRLMWMKDANYSASINTPFFSYFLPDGQTTLFLANESLWWVNAVATPFDYNDWRLPTGDMCMGYYCKDSELGSLYFNELGMPSIYDENASWPNDYGPFVNVKKDFYLSYVDYENADLFSFSDGRQLRTNHYEAGYVWFVRDTGPIAPEPVSSALFVIGGATLAAAKIRKKNKI